jgi:hypothetical protein
MPNKESRANETERNMQRQKKNKQIKKTNPKVEENVKYGIKQ